MFFARMDHRGFDLGLLLTPVSVMSYIQCTLHELLYLRFDIKRKFPPQLLFYHFLCL